MAAIDLKKKLENLIQRISQRNTYYGNKIPDSIMAMFEIEERSETSMGILVPYWLPVLQKGRGPRKNTKDYQLWKRIYAWMDKNSMFTSQTMKGKLSEAKSMTWYINKYGNKHFRSGTFVDVYQTERQNTIDELNRETFAEINRITMDAI